MCDEGCMRSLLAGTVKVRCQTRPAVAALRLGDTGHTTTRIPLPSMTLGADYHYRRERVSRVNGVLWEARERRAGRTCGVPTRGDTVTSRSRRQRSRRPRPSGGRRAGWVARARGTARESRLAAQDGAGSAESPERLRSGRSIAGAHAGDESRLRPMSRRPHPTRRRARRVSHQRC